MATREPRVRRRPQGERGAILVEAIIVAAMLVLLFVGVVYVHELFTSRLRAQESSRAAALAFAMNACEGDPTGGLAPDDARLVNAPATAPGSSNTVADAQKGKLTEPAAASAFDKAVAKNNGFGMPAAASVSALGTVSATDGKDTLTGQVRSRTTLLCNEKPREGTLDDAIETVADFMNF